MPATGQMPHSGSPQPSTRWGTADPSGGPSSPSPCPPTPIHLGTGCWLVPEASTRSAATLAPPGHLSFSDVSHDSARVSWEGVSKPVRLFRISFASSDGSHSGEVRAAPAQGPLGGVVSSRNEVNRVGGDPAPSAPPPPHSQLLGVGWAPGRQPWPDEERHGPCLPGGQSAGVGGDWWEARNWTHTPKRHP